MYLDNWVKENSVKETMLYNKAAYSSFKQMEEVASFWGDRAEVVGSHRSKSIELPVIQTTGPAGTLILRDNFHDIKVSFVCPKPIDHNLFGITVGTSYYLSPTCFEGFDPNNIFGAFHVGVDKFSAGLYDYNHVKELCGVLLAYFFSTGTDNDEALRLFAYKSDLVRKLNRDENLALGYGLPVVKTGSLFRFFSNKWLDRKVVVPINEQYLKFILSYNFVDHKNNFETLSFPHLDFTQGVPFNQEDWLKTIAKIVESQRKINTAYLDTGARFSFSGIDVPTWDLIKSLGLANTFTNDKQ